MTFLKKGQKDKIGVFKEASKGKEVSSEIKPFFYTEFENFVESRNSENAVVVQVSNFDMKLCHRADLLLRSRDFNNCDFSLQLANCLTKDSATIYMECKNVNNRGLKRMLAILKDVKALFDNRVRIIIVTESSMKAELSQLSEHDFSCSEPVNKKPRVEENDHLEGASEEKKSEENEQYLADQGSLEQTISAVSEYKAIIESKSKEVEKLSSEIGDLKQIKNLEESTYKDKMLESDKTIEKLNSDVQLLRTENDSLVKENNLLEKDKDKVSKENRILTLEVAEENEKINILMIERDNLKSENENLKKEIMDLKVDNDSLKLKRDELQSNIVQPEEESENREKYSDLKKLKEAILNNQLNLKNCLAPEIVKKSVPKLHFKAVTSRDKDGLVVFSVTILKGDLVQNYDNLLVFEGLGINTKIAKINAFDKFIENVVNYDPK